MIDEKKILKTHNNTKKSGTLLRCSTSQMTSGYILRCCDNILLLHQSHFTTGVGVYVAHSLTHTHSHKIPIAATLRAACCPNFKATLRMGYQKNHTRYLSENYLIIMAFIDCFWHDYSAHLLRFHSIVLDDGATKDTMIL